MNIDYYNELLFQQVKEHALQGIDAIGKSMASLANVMNTTEANSIEYVRASYEIIGYRNALSYLGIEQHVSYHNDKIASFTIGNKIYPVNN